MTKFSPKIPASLWPALGILCIVLSLPGFLGSFDAAKRSGAYDAGMPEIIDLEDFDPATHSGSADEVNIFAQTNTDYRFVIDGIGAGERYLVPLFSAMAGPEEKLVKHALLVDNLDAYDAWVADNVAGNARLGDLYQINGLVVDGKGYRASIRVTLRDAGLAQAENLIIIEPFIGGRAAGLGVGQSESLLMPVLLAAGGLFLIAFGLLRAKAPVPLPRPESDSSAMDQLRLAVMEGKPVKPEPDEAKVEALRPAKKPKKAPKSDKKAS